MAGLSASPYPCSKKTAMQHLTALIIEDEPMARKSLVQLLSRNFPELEIVGTTGSVRESAEWLRTHSGTAAPDVILMDVELSDGDCFEIFRQVDITSEVIMTTAYDNYAVKAFRVNSIDYLLKPLEVSGLKEALERAELRISDRRAVAGMAAGTSVQATPRRDKFLIRLNDRIVPVGVDEIAYFYSESKSSYLAACNGHRFVLDDSLDTIEQTLDPDKFFRISRSCIFCSVSIDNVMKLPGSRLMIALREGIEARTEMVVSRARVDNFMVWLAR